MATMSGPAILRGDPKALLGSGDGSGYGYGCGSGSGDGYGDYGCGSGYGNGYGYGDGDGSASKDYWVATIASFSAKWPDGQRAKLSAAKASGAIIAFWRSTSDGTPANGGSHIEPAAPGVIHTAAGPLELCTAGTLHATLIPPKWNGARYWVVALHGPVIGDEEKYGCLKREILGEAL